MTQLVPIDEMKDGAHLGILPRLFINRVVVRTFEEGSKEREMTSDERMCVP